MFRNYIVIALRNLYKNKFYSAINIIGLSVGLAVGIMILFWVQDELSFDRFHDNASKIYKVNSHLGSGIAEQVWEGSPAPVATFSKAEIPAVENSVRIRNNYEMSLFSYGDKKLVIHNTAYVDKSFFDVFSFKLVEGDASQVFRDVNSVVITKTTARSLFGDADPLGKVFAADSKENFTVTGVLEDFPQNSSIKYTMLFPMQNFAKKFQGNGDWKTIDEDMGNYMYNIYLQIKPGIKISDVEKRMSASFQQKHPGDTRFTLQSLKNVHLYAANGNGGAMQTVKTFLMVAILILLIACINYVNLSTARSMLRSKEVSVRKIIGAARMQLFIQFIVESALLFLIGSIIAIVAVKFLFPVYNQISAKNLVFSLSNKNMWMVMLCAIVGSLVVGSIYPALLLSSFKPIEALKGKLSFGAGNTQFRKILVVVQFVFSVALIISTIVISMQLKYISEKNLGYDKEHIFSFPVTQQAYDHYAALRTDLMKMPGVTAVSSSNNNVIAIDNTTGDTEWDGKSPESPFFIHPTGVDEHFIPLFNMQLAEGRNFTGEKSDSAHVILNETAVKEAGIKDPVGKRFKVWDREATIIGVVKDFNFTSLRNRIEPALFYYGSTNWRVFVKTTGKDAGQAVNATQSVWQKYSPGYPFSFSFVDEDFDAMYRTEQRTGLLFNIFAVVAILISCLGLFGLAAYTAQVKTKEIGIRKVLGATVTNIIQLLAKDFVWLVLISLVIAIPLGWWAMNTWLLDFAFRINISWWIFAAAGCIAMAIAVFTVSMHAIRAALANPVNSLKDE